MTASRGLTGVLLMSFGTPSSPDEVPDYLARVRGGRPMSPEVVAEMQRRYLLIGGSPLTRLTREQAAALEARLNADGDGAYRVEVGMRHAQPWIADALADLAADGAEQVVALVMSPQYSDVIMGGYLRALEEARQTLPRPVPTRVAGPWHTLPAFVDALAQRVREALDGLPASDRDSIPLLLTAHSLPKTVADREPSYMDQLRDTARLVAEAVGIPDERWRFAYQSAGHAPQEWLRPDLTELFPELRQAGHSSVLVAPVQFLADHLELLYDIDIAAREQADGAGLRLYRAGALNTMPQFIRALADVVQREEKRMSPTAVAS